MTGSKSRSQNATNEYFRNVADAQTRLKTIRNFAESYIVLRRGDALAKSVARLQNPRHFSQKRRKECRQSSVQSSVTGSQSVIKLFPVLTIKRRARLKPPTFFVFWRCSLFLSSLHSAVDLNCFISL